MSESKARESRQRRFLNDNPHCYFCGGKNLATTIDHVPPKAAFPDGFAPEGFESPACKMCNEGTTQQDQIFGFYSMWLDFDETKLHQEEQLAKLRKLQRGIANRYPEAFPRPDEARAIHQIGSILTPSPAAIVIPVQECVKDSLRIMGQKHTHALYYRETGKILTDACHFFTSTYQPQRGGTETLTSYFESVLPQLVIGDRGNIKEYGERFKYKCGYKADEEFFAFAAQFGHGLIVWGVVCGPSTPRPSAGPLAMGEWLRGACGAGSLATV